MTYWTEIDSNLDLPEDGLLAVSMRNPDAKPDIRLVPVEPDTNIFAPDGTLLGVIIYNDAGREFDARVEAEMEAERLEAEGIGDTE